MIFGRKKVDEDLDRIRRANLPEKYGTLAELEAMQQRKKERPSKKSKSTSEDRIGAKDIFAMIIAVFSLVLPYIIVFCAIMGMVILALLWFIR